MRNTLRRTQALRRRPASRLSRPLSSILVGVPALAVAAVLVVGCGPDEEIPTPTQSVTPSLPFEIPTDLPTDLDLPSDFPTELPTDLELPTAIPTAIPTDLLE